MIGSLKVPYWASWTKIQASDKELGGLLVGVLGNLIEVLSGSEIFIKAENYASYLLLIHSPHF